MSGPGNPPRHFLDLDRLDTATLRGILDRAVAFKSGRGPHMPLAGKTLVMIFEKPSTRTRVSFQVGMQELGGHTVVLGEKDSQLGRGETVADTARVLSRYADAIVIRTGDPAKLAELETHATVPVINGLTNASHPCQIMADVMTFEEHRGPIADKRVAWVGDGNNVAVSWIHAAVQFAFELSLATPPELAVDPGIIAWAAAQGGKVTVTEDAAETAAGADLVVTDTWVSMGDTDAETRCGLLEPYRVDGALMDKASPEALFMHCLPAHRGEEVTADVIDGPRSVVWDEAENRLHAQKGILAWCLDKS